MKFQIRPVITEHGVYYKVVQCKKWCLGKDKELMKIPCLDGYELKESEQTWYRTVLFTSSLGASKKIYELFGKNAVIVPYEL